MKIKHLLFAMFSLYLTSGACDSLTLLNNSNTQLKAQVLDANGKLLNEMTIEAGNTATWSLDYIYFGYDADTVNPPIPYSVIWYCPSGDVFGTCRSVNSDSTVTAKSCSGPRKCLRKE